MAGIVKLVWVEARAVEKMMSFAPFGRVRDLSNTFTLTASGVNPLGTVQLSVGVAPVFEIVTLVGKGAGSEGIPAKLGVTAVATSGPFWKVRFQLPVRVKLNGVAVAQKLALTASGPQLRGPTVKPPWAPVIVVVAVGGTRSAPN